MSGRKNSKTKEPEAEVFEKRGFVDVDVAQLVKADWNYKREDAARSAQLKENIGRNGQVETILVRRLAEDQFEIVNGNHRLDAFRELGIETVHVFDLGTCGDAAARRIAVETNETRFNSDSAQLAIILNQIVDEFGKEDSLLTLPYSDDELASILAIKNFTFDDFDGADGEEHEGVDPAEKVSRIIVSVSPVDEDEVRTAVLKAMNKFGERVTVK